MCSHLCQAALYIVIPLESGRWTSVMGHCLEADCHVVAYVQSTQLLKLWSCISLQVCLGIEVALQILGNYACKYAVFVHHSTNVGIIYGLGRTPMAQLGTFAESASYSCAITSANCTHRQKLCYCST